MEIELFCPTIVTNLCCGLDVLGLSLESAGAELTVRRTATPGLHIEGHAIPSAAQKNLTEVANALRSAAKKDGGLAMEIHSALPASDPNAVDTLAAGVAFGLNALWESPFTADELLRLALGSGAGLSAAALAPALLGGITLVRSTLPLDVVRIESPGELHVAVLHPLIEAPVADARQRLSNTVSLRNAVAQSGNLGALVSGLHTGDYDLIGRSLQDGILETNADLLPPGFPTLKTAAIKAGALGCVLSGLGPTIFALSKGQETARQVAEAMGTVCDIVSLPHESRVSAIGAQGVRVLDRKT